jgi:hypothetical protein
MAILVTNPVRLQLGRTKGFNLLDVSLATNGLPVTSVARPSPLGNPFVVCVDSDQTTCVALYRALVVDGSLVPHSHARSPDLAAQRKTIKAVNAALPGLHMRNLACWCAPGTPCHADVLLELANP